MNRNYLLQTKNAKEGRIRISSGAVLGGILKCGSYGVTSDVAVNGATNFLFEVLPGDAIVENIIQRQTIANGSGVTVLTRSYNGTVFTSWSVPQNGVNVKYVSTTTELEAAIAAQTAGQFIYLYPGAYVLTKELTPLAAADGGGLIGVGNVTITGAAAADSAIHLIAYAAGTFEYTLGGSLEVEGGHDKIGLKITNVGVSQKIIVYINDDVHFIDHNNGVAVSAVNTGTGAMRIYATCNFGTGWDTVNITNKNADDKWHFRGISFDTTINVTEAGVADNWWFENCKVPLAAAVTGGDSTSVLNIVNCHTMTGAAVTAVNASTDFPDFSPTVI